MKRKQYRAPISGQPFRRVDYGAALAKRRNKHRHRLPVLFVSVAILANQVTFFELYGQQNVGRRFTSRFIPGGSDEQVGWFNELCRKTTSPEIAARLLETRATIDVIDLLDQVRAPTLVLHSRDDDVIPIGEGHILAAAIPGAQFVELDSRNHILLESEPAWERFRTEVLGFMEHTGVVHDEDPAFASLSPREREVLALITEGLGNAEIAERLSISEKTVRNHVSNLFDKLGVWSRAQAMVFAQDHGFRST